jgi:8-oxo-dGTP diphosphatase
VIIIVYIGELISGQPCAGDETLEAQTFAPEEIPWDELAFPSTIQALREYLAMS